MQFSLQGQKAFNLPAIVYCIDGETVQYLTPKYKILHNAKYCNIYSQFYLVYDVHRLYFILQKYVRRWLSHSNQIAIQKSNIHYEHQLLTYFNIYKRLL